MTFEEIIAKLREIEAKLLAKHPEISHEKQFQVLARTAKVSEEYGELINEVLASLKLQRQSKLDQFDSQNLEKEFGDVFNALMLLGFSLELDVKNVITKRVIEMYERNKN